MAIDPGADRGDLDPDNEQPKTTGKEHAANEGMLAPEEDVETWGELESEKLDSEDISGLVPGDD